MTRVRHGDGDLRSKLPLRLDCRQYRGDRPCAAREREERNPGACPEPCRRYEAVGTRFLIIKLAAPGDVIRTAALLPGLKEHWPESQITWITRPAGVRMLAGQPLIDRLLVFDAETICQLEYEQFDVC